MIQVPILDGNEAPLNAKVEMKDGTIILHSRSGKVSNRDYRPALESILRRLHEEKVPFEVYLDSAPSQGIPLADRRLATHIDLAGEEAEQFSQLVHSMNANSKSNGAYRRLRIDTAWMPDYALSALIGGRVPAPGLDSAILRRVRRSDILDAFEELESAKTRHLRFAEPTRYWVISPSGTKHPPKAVFGIALGNALRTYIGPQHFYGGPKATPALVMRDNGFSIVHRKADGGIGDPVYSEVPQFSSLGKSNQPLPLTQEDQEWTEGDKKARKHLRRERAAGLAKRKKDAFAAEHGSLFCEDCEMDPIFIYGDEVGDACLEVHHILPLSEYRKLGKEATRLEDLKVLCANCHRAEHRRMKTSK